MPIDVNSYNAQFRQFVDFATQAHKSGSDSKIAQIGTAGRGVDGANPLAGRTIVPKSQWDFVGNIGRLAASRATNDSVRELFRSTIVDMFGGESKVPQGVKDAMKLADYGKGKPLTARRILAVSAAVTAEVAKLNQAKSAALSDGFTKTEVETMSKVAGFYSEATGCTRLEAFQEVAKAGTNANRLLNYGGRFLESADNFRNGLRLLDSFKSWFTGVGDALQANGGTRGDRKEGMSKTLLTADVATFSPVRLRGVEKFVFEHSANDPSFDLAETDENKLFGMENNPATHFLGRALYKACAQTVAQIPPERRKTFFTAVNLFYPILDNAADANKRAADRGEVGESKLIVGRVLKNLDKIAEMEANGTLTFKNLAKVCVPELPEDSAFEFKEVGDKLNAVLDSVNSIVLEKNLPIDMLVKVVNTMYDTGCSLDEALDAANGGKSPPTAPYVSSGTLEIEAFDGTTKAGRKQLQTDLVRPKNYGDMKNNKDLLPEKKVAFTFNFPGEPSIETNETKQGKENIETVLNKIESLCGKAHPAQASSVMAQVSQSGLADLYGGLTIHGIRSSEHVACDFSLSKDDATGDVTIRYSSPEGLPFSFEWTATVKVDGTVTTTPFQYNGPDTL